MHIRTRVVDIVSFVIVDNLTICDSHLGVMKDDNQFITLAGITVDFLKDLFVHEISISG